MNTKEKQPTGDHKGIRLYRKLSAKTDKELHQALLEAIPLQTMSAGTGSIRKKICIPDLSSEAERLEASGSRATRFRHKRMMSMVGVARTDNEDEPKSGLKATSSRLSQSDDQNQQQSAEACAEIEDEKTRTTDDASRTMFKSTAHLEICMPDAPSAAGRLKASGSKKRPFKHERIISMVGYAMTDKEDESPQPDGKNPAPYQSECSASSNDVESVFVVMSGDPKSRLKATSRRLSQSGDQNQQEPADACAEIEDDKPRTSDDDCILEMCDDVDGDLVWVNSTEYETESSWNGTGLLNIPKSNKISFTIFAVIFATVVIGTVLFSAICVWGPAIRSLFQPM